MPVRVRFAPSPTGPLHIGGVRTALYNYLFARKQKGVFILRIEDTDRLRYIPGTEKYILDSLYWLRLIPDEGPDAGGDFGPYKQSERREIYQEHIERLIQTGHAYYAFDTPEELEKMREELKSQGVAAPKYDASVRMNMHNSLSITEEELYVHLEAGTPYAIRLKVDPGNEVRFNDLIRGDVKFQSEDLDDKVILKADGMPTYHLANVVDDHLMEITHVIRGEEWLSSTAHHVLLYEAFGWSETVPLFAHLPLILKPSGQGKLSKRDGVKFGFPVFPLSWNADGAEHFTGFKEFGFDPEALLNFLAFLGWNPGTEQEMFSLQELVDAFSLHQITKSGARFDFQKASWYNAQYIQSKTTSELVEIVRPVLGARGIDSEEIFLRAYCNLLKERVITYEEFYTKGLYFFEDPVTFDEKTVRKKWDAETANRLSELINILNAQEHWIAEELQAMIKDFIQQNNLKFGNVFPLLRVAISGMPQGPDIFLTLSLLGKEIVLRRLREAIPRFNTFKKEMEV